MNYILALDQGTTSARAILFNKQGEIVNIAQKNFNQYYPQAGWVEHDAMEIWGAQSGVAREVLETAGIRATALAAIGITNQCETTVIWDRQTGKPIHRAIVWQCRRTADICEQLKDAGLSDYIRMTTGLVIDAYFSATKIKWLLDHVPNARARAKRGELLFGTIDSWLIWNLTRGKLHVTDYSNASRTMLYDINKLCWDETLLEVLDIPAQILPRVIDSSAVIGYSHESIFGDVKVPLAGVAGDQQAALFGQMCFENGMVKNTYGTGCFILMKTGSQPILSKHGLLTTIAWRIGGELAYAIEGSVFMGGAILQWLRDEMHLINDINDSEYFAQKVADSNGIYLVPAFAGLGAPHWDMYARGAIVGLTRGVNRNHLIRAALESIAYQSLDVMRAMQEDAAMAIKSLKVDGAATSNNFLLQFQADIMGQSLIRPAVTETTALGAAYLAGLAVGFWQSKDDIKRNAKIDRLFKPQMAPSRRQQLYHDWQRAIERAKNWQ